MNENRNDLNFTITTELMKNYDEFETKIEDDPKNCKAN